ncbi:hypothetical protein ANAEL_05431 [Anaerolineales bacterium]|nr:hypothetical protein ANAEL_05431 [Anaerolineales bacterium]
MKSPSFALPYPAPTGGLAAREASAPPALCAGQGVGDAVLGRLVVAKFSVNSKRLLQHARMQPFTIERNDD